MGQSQVKVEFIFLSHCDVYTNLQLQNQWSALHTL